MSTPIFRKFSKELFEATLKEIATSLDLTPYRRPKDPSAEWVYVLKPTVQNKAGSAQLDLLVYSSVSRKSGQARPKGTDQIRLVLTEPKTGHIVCGKEECKRTTNWQKTLANKIAALIQKGEERLSFHHCGAPMIVVKDRDNRWVRKCSACYSKEEEKVDES